MTLGLVTCHEWPELIENDQALIPFLAEYGIQAKAVVWDDAAVDYNEFDGLLIRSTWDYFEKIDAFTQWLNMVESRRIPVFNSIETIRMNMHKSYLSTLENHGLPIIPTYWIDAKNKDIAGLLESLPEGDYIIKPAISGGSYLTEKFDTSENLKIVQQYTPHLTSNDFMVQPFVESIKTTGEVSLLYFDGEYSHSVVKTPKMGDFRIQSQYGGVYLPFQPDQDLISMGENAIETIAKNALYGRVDVVLINGVYSIMEVELIEPDLYFHIHPETRNVFVQKIVEKCRSLAL